MTPVHKTLSRAKWQSMGLNEQLANIGSEVGRIIHWQRAQDGPQTDRALERALELIDLTLDDKRWRPRWIEVARLREALCDSFAGEGTFEIPPESLEDYFLAFALRIRFLTCFGRGFAFGNLIWPHRGRFIWPHLHHKNPFPPAC
jgi:hypothetical protein